MLEQTNENQIRERAAEKLDFYVKNCVVYIDTCSLLHFASLDFFDNIEGLLTKYTKQLNVLSGGLQELEKHSRNREDSNLASNAKKTIRMLNQFAENNMVKWVEKEGFVDNAFLTLFTDIRMECYPLLITQDKNLAKDILNLNKTLSVRANRVRVARINQYGYLSEVCETRECLDFEIQNADICNVYDEDNTVQMGDKALIKDSYGDAIENLSAEHASLIEGLMSEMQDSDICSAYDNDIIVHPSDKTLIKNSHWLINEDLKNADEYEFECFTRNFLIEKIYEVIPEESETEYRHVAKLINCLDPILFERLDIKTNRILLVTQINSIFKEATNECIVEEILYIAIESLVKNRFGIDESLSILGLTEEQKQKELSLEDGVCSLELTRDTYDYYSRFYFIEKIYEIIPEESEIRYGHVAKLINCIDPYIVGRLNTQIGQTLMVNEIISLFMEATDTVLPKDYLMKIAEYLGAKKM